MLRPIAPLVVAFLCIVTCPAAALAQSSEPDTTIRLSVGEQPTAASKCFDLALQQDLEHFERRSKRARNALIGTSIATGVGIVFIVVGNSQCQVISRPGQDSQLLCNTAGDVLWGLGFGMTASGALGALISGIILGVSNKRQREVRRDIRERHSAARLRWDARSGGFVF